MANENNGSRVQTVGHRIRYIEPNYTSDSRLMQGPRGLHTYEFENPLEDYCIFVNLKVEVRGRAIRTDYTTNSKTYTMNYYSQQGKEAVSFLQGTNYPTAKQNVYGKDVPSLTTDYLDHLYLNDLVKRDANDVVSGTSTSTELFGINSIDIQYNNWMVPEVTIKFTDVRGASLFAAEEARHHLTDSQGVNANADASVEGSFFKCFFTFPYPKFTLCVKGFYGQPVAYELTCSDFRASFNSDTGNFEATAKFVGYAFSFLGDVMMNALTAAPFSDYLGRKYWEENVSNGRFVVKDVNGQDVPMMTIGEIVTKIDSAMNEASGMVASSPEVQEGLQLEEQSKQINSVSTAYQAYTTAIYNCIKNAVEGSTEDTGEFNFAIQDGANLLAFIPGASAGDTFNGATTSWWKPWDENKELDSALESLQKVVEDKEEYKSKVEKINFKNLKPIEVYNKYGHYTGNTTLDSFSAIKNGINRNEEISNSRKDGNENLIQRKELFYGYPFIDNDLSGQLKKDKEQTDAAIQENQAEISEVTNKAIADCLGFNPTVESITRIVMAHFETLTYMLTMCARDITGQNRTLESLGITTENTKDVSPEDKVVPPFPKITKHVTEEGVEKDEEAWVGDFQGDWLEKDIVNGLLNGINEMSELIKNAASGSTNESGNLTAIMKVPLNPLDMILDKNPYGEVNFDDKSDFAGHIVLRMFEILSLNKEFADVEDVNKLGEAEAINFKEFFKSPPQEFKQWLQDEKAVENIINIVKADSTNTPVDKYGKSNKYAWESIKGSSTKHRALIKDWTLNEFNGNGKTYLPIQNASFSKIISDLGSPDANGKYRYPRTPKDYMISNSSKGINSGGTSVASSSGKLICIEPNPDRFSIIAENQCKNTGVNGELEKLYEKFIDEAKYDASKFCKYIQGGKKFIKVYTNGTSNSTEESSEDNDNEQETATTTSISTPQDIDDWAEKFNNGLDGFSKDSAHKVDEYRVLFIPAIKPDDSDIEDIDDNTGGAIASNGTLFAQNYYYTRSLDEKAFLYLLSLGYYVNYGKAFDDLFDDGRCFTTAPKASVLFAGCLCYFADKKDTDFEKSFLKMSDDKRIKNLRVDVRNDLAAYFKKWAFGEFAKIDSYLSLKVDDTKAFFEDMTKSKGVVYTSDKDIKRIIDKYLPGLGANYGAVDDSIHWIGGESAMGGPSIRLGMKPDSYGALMTTRLVLGSSTFVKTSDVFSGPSETFKIKNGKGEAFLKGFVSKLKESYLSDSGGTESSPTSTERAADCKTDPDIKIGVYRYLKLLYDKWIAGSVFEQDFTIEKFFENPDKYFYFIDSYYNKIGDLIICNMGKFKDDVLNCETQDGYTLLSFLSQTYSQNKCNFLCIQNFLDLAETSNMERMFEPVSMMDMNIPDVTPNFIVQYPYETSSHLDLGDDGDYNYPDDSFSISKSPQMTGTGSEANKWPAPLNSGEDAGYYIPAFGVSYGKQYQSYFNNISISMDNPMVTEQSIKAQFEIASMNNENAKNNEGTSTRGMITMGQDLFTIYSNNSYTCEIDMMGDAWMQPLMYFELLNIPMFRGTYLIEKVSHHIEAGKMSTHIVGVRMANTTTKIKKGWFWAADPVKTGEDEEDMENQLADVTNDCAYASYPLGGVGGGIGGMLISQNGLSAMNYYEAGNNKWYTGGDKGKNNGDGAGTTCGPGLTGKYLSHGKTASGLKQGFLDALRDHDKRIRKWIKGKKFKQESIDSFYHLDHWGPGLAQSKIPNFHNDKEVSNFWLGQYKKGKNAKDNPGWQGFCCGYAWIIDNAKPSPPDGWYTGQEARAKAGYDIYHSLDKPLLQAMHLSAPPAVNDKTQKDGKTKGIWDDFVYSVNQTSQNTPSCGLNVGSVKKGPNQGWLTTGNNGTGGADKLATVFDIVLNAYGEYVQELWWVARNNHDNQGPDHLEVIVSEKPKMNSIKVGMKILGSDEPFKGINENSNEKYRRAIVKFYSQNNRHSSKSENEGVYGKVVQSKIPKSDWEKLKPTSCAELMQEAGGGDYSGGGTIDANKKIGRWNVGKSCQYAISHARSKSTGQCAKYVCNAIEAGGIKSPRQDKAWQIRANQIPQKQGWSLIKDGTITKDQNESLNSGRQMGDIGVMGSAQTERSSSPRCFHMAIWTGNEWVSDYRQGNEMVPGNYFKYTPNFPYSIYRYNG